MLQDFVKAVPQLQRASAVSRHIDFPRVACGLAEFWWPTRITSTTNPILSLRRWLNRRYLKRVQLARIVTAVGTTNRSHRGNAVRMIMKKRLPALRWRSPPPRHVFGHDSWRDGQVRRRASCLTPALAPSNYRTNTHLEDLGYLPPRRSAFNRFNRTLTQVRGIRPWHRFSSPGESISPDSPTRQRLGIPPIQCRREML
jgi:hypothetical protein